MIIGTNGVDDIDGTSRRDVVVARGGADDIRTLGGADIVCAGDGADTAEGGGGGDLIMGEAGKDTLRGNAGQDEARGGEGVDGCFASEVVKTCEADIVVSMTSSAAYVNYAEPFDVTFAYRNKGPSPTPGTELLFSYSLNATAGEDPTGCIIDSKTRTGTCSLGNLPSGESSEVVVSLYFDCDAHENIHVSGEIGSSQGDPVPANNEDNLEVVTDQVDCL